MKKYLLIACGVVFCFLQNASVLRSQSAVTATSGVLNVANGKTFTVNNAITITGTDATTITTPATSSTMARTDAAQTFTGVQTFNNPIAPSSGGTGINNSATLTLGSSNQNWAALASGIVKNTTTTGALSQAGAVDFSAANYAVGGGTAQAQNASYSPALTVLNDGQFLCWKPNAANTGAAPTFTPNSGTITVHNIVKIPNATALLANDLITTQIACAVYNSTSTNWELQNPATAAGGSGVTNVSIAATSNQTTATGTCNITSTGTCTVGLATAIIVPGSITMSTYFQEAVNTVASSTAPNFDLSLGNIQTITALGANATATFSNITVGRTYKFLICQDATGGRTFSWPGTAKGAMAISATANACSAQTFYSNGTNLYALAPGLIGM